MIKEITEIDFIKPNLNELAVFMKDFYEERISFLFYLPFDIICHIFKWIIKSEDFSF